MSMLAEPRRRQKWSLNPRGTDWANDDNKFGQKLMEKMGWSKGKGLGRKEQGMKEHISLKFKDNSKGLGYNGKDDEWIKHYEGFEDVLTALNSEHNSAANSKNGSSCNSSANSDEEIDQKNKKSLEVRSKVSKARVHYHKFTRGKDLSRYNEDDIACILGSKRAKKLAEAKADEKSTTEVDEIGHVDNLNGVTTIKGCTVKDYFEQKMAALKRSVLPEMQTRENREEGEEESLLKPGFGSGLDIEYLDVSLKNGKVKEKKHKKDKIVEKTSEVSKKRKKKYALEDEDEERKEANQKIKLQEKKDKMEENLSFELKVEENLSSESKKSVKRKTTLDDESSEYYTICSKTFAELETNGKERKKKKTKREEPLEDELDEDNISEMISRQKPDLDKVEKKCKVDYGTALESQVTEEETRPSSKKKMSLLISSSANETIKETVVGNIKQLANTKENKVKKRKKPWEEEDVLQKSKGEGVSESKRKHEKKKKLKYEKMINASLFEAQNMQQLLNSKKRKKERKFEYVETDKQTIKQDTEAMHDLKERIKNMGYCTNTEKNKAKKRKKNCREEVEEKSECNRKHKMRHNAKNEEVVDASLFYEAQDVQKLVKTNKKKFRYDDNECDEQTNKQDNESMHVGQEDTEVKKKAEHEEVVYASQLGETENIQQLLKYKIKKIISKSKYDYNQYEEETIKQDTEAIPNAQENAECLKKQEKKKTRKEKVNHLEENDKQENDDRAVIGLSFDSQQVKRKRKDKKRHDKEKLFQEEKHVINDVPEKFLKNSEEAENMESAENPDVQLDKTSSISNNIKKTTDWLDLDFIDIFESGTFPEEIESLEIRRKRRTKHMYEILSKMNVSHRTLRRKLKSFTGSFGSPENLNKPSFLDSGTDENVSLDNMGENMEDLKNKHALEIQGYISNKCSERGTAIQDNSFGSEQFDNNKTNCEKSRPRLSETESNKVDSVRSKFTSSDEYVGDEKESVHFGEERHLNQRNCDYSTPLRKSDVDKGLSSSSHIERSDRGAGMYRSHYMGKSGRGRRKDLERGFHNSFENEQKLCAAARAFKGANIWKCKGYKL